MSQNDFTIANQSFPAFRADLNSALQALASNSSGASAPSTTFANMWWYDSTNNIMYIRNEDNDAWIKFAELDQTNDKFVLSGTLQLDDGTVSAPALTFNSDTNMGIYRGGTDILKFVTAGTDAITIDASQNVDVTGAVTAGGLTVDASIPTLQLNDTDGTNQFGKIRQAGSNLLVTSRDNTSNGGFRVAGDNGTSETIRFNIASNGDISFYEDTGTTAKFFWDASAESLGIGTSSPTVLDAGATGLHLHGDTRAQFHLTSSTTGTAGTDGMYLLYDGVLGALSMRENQGLRFDTNATERMRLDASGNLLVGTTSESGGLQNKLTSHSAGKGQLSVIDTTAYSTANVGGALNLGGNYRTDGDAQGFCRVEAVKENTTNLDYSYAMQFSTTKNGNANYSTVAMRIDSSGKVGIGTDSPATETSAWSGSANGLVIENDANAILVLKDSTDTTFRSFIIQDSGNLKLFNENSSGFMNFGTNNTERMRILNTGVLLVGKTADDNTSPGATLSTGGNGFIRSGAAPVAFNRTSNDGEVVRIQQDGTTEGSISVSGTTVSYNGGHLSRWSRLLDNSKDSTILKGTVMTNLDEMVEWDDEDNEQLNKMAVSSIEGDANVAGVFVNWDEDDDWNDMNIAMTGDMVIRIAQGTTVARGDLLMSAGDGTAKPQGDDIVRSKTIAKVTSTNVSHTYDDGTYLVPCVLMAC